MTDDHVTEDLGALREAWVRMEQERLAHPRGWVHPDARPSSRRAATVHQMKITLNGVKPPVWRRVVIPSNHRLDELAEVLLAAMGWTNSHLHAFFIGECRYDMVGHFSEGDELDERGFVLRDVFDGVGKRMRFEYDFGDGWEHDVLLEAVRLKKKAESEPTCLAGRRACPPEDCGGPWRYVDLLELRARGARNEDEREQLEWLGETFDPDHFDAEETTRRMRNPVGWLFE